MVVGYLLFGWCMGLTMAIAYGASGAGSWVATLGVFFLVSNLSVLLVAARVALRRYHDEQQEMAAALIAPVPPMPARARRARP